MVHGSAYLKEPSTILKFESAQSQNRRLDKR